MDIFPTYPSVALELAELDFAPVDDDGFLLVELLGLRDRLVEKAEEISMRLDAQMNPGPAVSLSGDERKKAVHLFRSQAAKLERELFKLGVLAEKFRVHIY